MSNDFNNIFPVIPTFYQTKMEMASLVVSGSNTYQPYHTNDLKNTYKLGFDFEEKSKVFAEIWRKEKHLQRNQNAADVFDFHVKSIQPHLTMDGTRQTVLNLETIKKIPKHSQEIYGEVFNCIKNAFREKDLKKSLQQAMTVTNSHVDKFQRFDYNKHITKLTYV